jgi:hypothetical protein
MVDGRSKCFILGLEREKKVSPGPLEIDKTLYLSPVFLFFICGNWKNTYWGGGGRFLSFELPTVLIGP